MTNRRNEKESSNIFHLKMVVYKTDIQMKGVKKQHLPSKMCPVCQRPFAWRKKWEKNWEAVIYCSERCKTEKGKTE